MRIPVLISLLSISSASAGVITFDDLPQFCCGAPLPTVYHGLTWYGWGYETPDPAVNNGYHNALLSPPNIVFNEGGGLTDATVSATTPFIPISANFAAAFNDGMTITVDASLFGFPVGSFSFLTNTSTPSFEYFDFGPVTELYFSASGGALNLNADFGRGSSSEYFGMDNLSISPDPQGSLELGTMCIAGAVVFLCRRWRRMPSAFKSSGRLDQGSAVL
jgi:hypothetical protein